MSDDLVDVEQLRLDLEDAHARLDRIARALAAEQDLARAVNELTVQLRDARRKLKEARWEVASATAPVRRLIVK